MMLTVKLLQYCTNSTVYRPLGWKWFHLNISLLAPTHFSFVFVCRWICTSPTDSSTRYGTSSLSFMHLNPISDVSLMQKFSVFCRFFRFLSPKFCPLAEDNVRLYCIDEIVNGGVWVLLSACQCRWLNTCSMYCRMHRNLNMGDYCQWDYVHENTSGFLDTSVMLVRLLSEAQMKGDQIRTASLCSCAYDRPRDGAGEGQSN